jgi:hypothetical protein
MMRLPLKLEEIRKMIAKPPEIEEPSWGKELKERWTAETAEARAKADEARAERELRQYRSNLEELDPIIGLSRIRVVPCRRQLFHDSDHHERLTRGDHHGPSHPFSPI